MSGLLNTLHELHQQHKERHEERREAHQQWHGHGGHNDSEPDNYGSQPPHQRPYHGNDDEARLTQPYPSQGQGHGYVPPLNPPPSSREPSGFAYQGGLDRGDFASDADIARMVATGDFDRGQGPGDDGYGPASANLGRRNAYGWHDTPTVPLPGQGYGERVNECGHYNAPPGPPSGQTYQSQESYQQGYGSNLPNTHGLSQAQGRTQYDAPQGLPVGYGRGLGSALTGEFGTSHNAEERYGSGYGGPNSDREHQYKGEAASYYNQQSAPGQRDRYSHLAGMAQEHGDDPELYRRATQGLQERIQMQGQSRPPRKDDEEYDYKTHVNAHRKAYGDGDHGPMDADAIGSAAAMEAFKQTVAAKSSNAPTGAFQGGKASGGSPQKPGKVVQEEEEEEAATARAGGGGLQDKLMALAMSHASKLFDKKNVGQPGGVDKSQDKAQAMQSAAATAMELFKQYQTKGKLDANDMSKVVGLAMNLL